MMKKTLLIVVLLTTIQTTLAQSNLNNPNLIERIIAINHQNINRPLNVNKEVLTTITRLEHGTANTIQEDTFEYDSNGRTLAEQAINHIQPMYNTRREYAYDINGIISTIIDFNYDSGTSSFVYNYKYQVSEYNLFDLPYVVVGSNYASATSSWTPNFKDTISYNGLGKIQYNIQYTWDNYSNNWKPFKKYVYTYYPNGLIAEKVRDEYNSGTNDWREELRMTYTYDAQDRLTEQLYTWYQSSLSRDVYHYSTAGQLVLLEMQQGNSDIWDNSEKKEWIYDSNGNLLEVTNYYWDGNTWQYSDMENFNQFIYNNTYDRSDIITPISEQTKDQVDNYMHRLDHKELRFYDLGTNNWETLEDLDYFYINTSIAEVDNHLSEMIKIYPNPATNIINLQTMKHGSYYITDMSGKEIISGNLINGNNTLNIEVLKKGMYLVKYHVDNKFAIKKLIVE